MKTITVSPTHRIVISRSGMQNTALYQVLETNKWETRARKVFDGNWKGDIISEMKEEYAREQKKKAYQESKLMPYH